MWFGKRSIDYLLPWHLPKEYQEAKSTIERSIRNRAWGGNNFFGKVIHLKLFNSEENKELRKAKVLRL